MTPLALANARTHTEEHAARVAVVAALSATTMLFASLASAYLLRRSFDDWRPGPEAWPLALVVLGGAASVLVETAFRTAGNTRRAALALVAACSAFYLLATLGLIAERSFGEGGLSEPHSAFVVLLLSMHGAHAALGVLFSRWLLRGPSASLSTERWFLVRLVTHFLTLLLTMILGVLFVLR